MSSPKVSVLLPAYNHAEFLGDSIRSVLDQTYPDFELIVVNDGSTDATEEVVRSFEDPRLRYLYQENLGVPGALNTAFQAAQGDYIAIMNDDDLWLPDKLAIQAAYLDRHSDTGLLYAYAQLIDSQGRWLPQKLSLPGKFPGNMLASLLYEDCVCPVTVLVRRNCLEQAGPWDQALPGVDDWDMWLRLACGCKFHFMEQVLAGYRTHAANYSGATAPHFARYQELRVQVLDKFFAGSGCPESVRALKPIAYRNLYTVIGLQWIGVGNWRTGFQYFARAARVSPSPLTVVRLALNVLIHLLSRQKLTAPLVSRYITLRLKRRTAD